MPLMVFSNWYVSVDYETLEKELNCAIIKPMKELYYHWSDTQDCVLSFTCCPTIQPCTLAILDSFYRLATTGRSEIFHRSWRDNLLSFLAPRDCAFTQENIIKFVWKPTFKYCVELIASLEQGSITLSEVERIFCDDETLADIQLSCESLVKSLAPCSLPIFPFCTCEGCITRKTRQLFSIDTSVKTLPDMCWIQTVCKQIENYRLSQKCIECAKALIILCDEDHLNLNGDFISILVLGKKV